MPKLEEDRILREWTPILLRSILIAAMIFLIVGLILDYTFAPDYYVQRYQAVQHGQLLGKEKFGLLYDRVRFGKPKKVLKIGVLVLTLVQRARVAFCFMIFIRERDYTYVALPAYVLV